jgi:hypothetical protein
MDLGNKLGHAEVQDLPPLAARADHPAAKHERMLRAVKELEKEINALIRRAESLDFQEDRKGNLGSDLPDELRLKQSRLEKIPVARKEMDSDTAAAADRQRRPRPFGWCKSGGPTALIRE